jgi:hypothetical protein
MVVSMNKPISGFCLSAATTLASHGKILRIHSATHACTLAPKRSDSSPASRIPAAKSLSDLPMRIIHAMNLFIAFMLPFSG